MKSLFSLPFRFFYGFLYDFLSSGEERLDSTASLIYGAPSFLAENFQNAFRGSGQCPILYRAVRVVGLGQALGGADSSKQVP